MSPLPPREPSTEQPQRPPTARRPSLSIRHNRTHAEGASKKKKLNGLEISQLVLRCIDGCLAACSTTLLVYVSARWHWHYEVNYAATGVTLLLDVLVAVAIALHIPRQHAYLGICVVIAQLTAQVLLVIGLVNMMYASHADPNRPDTGDGGRMLDGTIYTFPAGSFTWAVFWMDVGNEGLGFVFIILEFINCCRERKPA